MINEQNKNKLYLADTLKTKHPVFTNNLERLLQENKIDYSFLPGTKDIWCRDYMPIQNGLGDFIKFDYSPDYLRSKTYSITKTDVTEVCRQINVNTLVTNIVLDGGNVVHSGNKVIMCDKVLKENPNLEKHELIDCLRYLFRVNYVLLIPTHPDDIFGHSDGILRFLNNNTVLVSDYSKDAPEYWDDLIYTLTKYKLKIIKVPCNTSKNKYSYDATGIYINYLQIGKHIILPSYDLTEDKIVEDQFKLLFPKHKVLCIKSNSIAKQGGVLNCISWTIEKNYPHPLTQIERELNGNHLDLYKVPNSLKKKLV